MSANPEPPAVIMIRPNLENIPDYRLPPGFRCRWYQPGAGRDWTAVWQAAEKWLTITEETFRLQFGRDETLLGQRQFFIDDPDGRPVATSTAWYNNSAVGTVHWVAIVPDCQGRGLGKPLMTITCQRLRDLGHTSAWLGTHVVRVPAINLYLHFGFVPDIQTDAQRASGEQLKPHLKHSVTL